MLVATCNLLERLVGGEEQKTEEAWALREWVPYISSDKRQRHHLGVTTVGILSC
jgi:hypothetical protein